MTIQRNYWVISPNVTNQEKIVMDWKKEILNTHVAIMGWSPNEYGHRRIGPKFAGKTSRSVQHGDVILIARRHNWKPEVIGFGVVKGECKEEQFPFSEHRVYPRYLEPFKPVQKLSENIPFIDVLQHTSALVQLHPDSTKKNPAWQVCEWLERQLGLKGQNNGYKITEVDLPKSTTFGYTVKTKYRISESRKREAKLLKDYKQWLKNRGRSLSALKYNRFQCDGWEKERQNLIEAKASTRREDIRMAVGQLLDYAYQGKEIYQQPHMAILLPSKPNFASIKWLSPLQIGVIWRSGRSFFDNANGQFI